MMASRNWRSALAGVALALLFGAVLAALLGYPPFDGYRALLRYSIGSTANASTPASSGRRAGSGPIRSS